MIAANVAGVALAVIWVLAMATGRPHWFWGDVRPGPNEPNRTTLPARIEENTNG